MIFCNVFRNKYFTEFLQMTTSDENVSQLQKKKEETKKKTFLNYINRFRDFG